ncbi:hypothetical protein EON82_20675 [bacterium]|nr:MAG: hypothetical protein EON82_20675 [bacterium]
MRTNIGSATALFGMAWIVALMNYDPKRSTLLIPQPDEPNYYLNLLVAVGLVALGLLVGLSGQADRRGPH